MIIKEPRSQILVFKAKGGHSSSPIGSTNGLAPALGAAIHENDDKVVTLRSIHIIATATRTRMLFTICTQPHLKVPDVINYIWRFYDDISYGVQPTINNNNYRPRIHRTVINNDLGTPMDMSYVPYMKTKDPLIFYYFLT